MCFVALIGWRRKLHTPGFPKGGQMNSLGIAPSPNMCDRKFYIVYVVFPRSLFCLTGSLARSWRN